LIAIDDIQRVLPPIGINVVLFQRCREDFVTRIFHADTERLEDLDGWGLAVTTAATRGRRVVLWIITKTTSAAGGGARSWGWVAAIGVAGEKGGVL